jgi:ankyrin repeat protein
MIELLRRRIAEVPALLPVDEFLGACMRADEPAARTILASHPDLMGSLTDEDQSALPQAAANGLLEAVRRMVSLGFDLAREERWGGTPLHWAARWGRTEVVKLLLERGAPINVRDTTYGSSPLAWIAHGSRFCRKADDEYCAIVEMLLNAGSDYETSINKWNEPPTKMGSPRVSKVFERRGFGPEYRAIARST